MHNTGKHMTDLLARLSKPWIYNHTAETGVMHMNKQLKDAKPAHFLPAHPTQNVPTTKVLNHSHR